MCSWGSHIRSMPPLSAARNFPRCARACPATCVASRPTAPSFVFSRLYSRGGVRRSISASNARIRVTRRSNSSVAALSRARRGSGKRACVCCMARASAIRRICFRLRGLSRSHSRRFALRFRPSHSSPVAAGRPASGSAIEAVLCGFVRIIGHHPWCKLLRCDSSTRYRSRVAVTSSTPPEPRN